LCSSSLIAERTQNIKYFNESIIELNLFLIDYELIYKNCKYNNTLIINDLNNTLLKLKHEFDVQQHLLFQFNIQIKQYENKQIFFLSTSSSLQVELQDVENDLNIERIDLCRLFQQRLLHISTILQINDRIDRLLFAQLNLFNLLLNFRDVIFSAHVEMDRMWTQLQLYMNIEQLKR
jgi:hypothetical protein